MTADLTLAIAHHLLVFSLFAILAVQLVLVRPGLGADGVVRLAAFDATYGAISLAVVVVGFSRAIWGLKGWEYYSGYWAFWAKLGAFLLVGLLSIRPTLRFRQWLKAVRSDAAHIVPAADIAAMRPWLHAEGFVLMIILVLAAMLARGVGY